MVVGKYYLLSKLLPWIIYNTANITFDLANHIDLIHELSKLHLFYFTQNGFFFQNLINFELLDNQYFRSILTLKFTFIYSATQKCVTS